MPNIRLMFLVLVVFVHATTNACVPVSSNAISRYFIVLKCCEAPNEPFPLHSIGRCYLTDLNNAKCGDFTCVIIH